MAITPMMQQYLQIKEEHKDAILFFRLGDFYEMFFDDAKLASRELELTLTGKDCGLSERAPMCGVPYHAVDVYIGRLIAKGYKIAICEQMTDPADAKGLVERSVTRIITPGTVIEGDMLDEHAPSYILSLCINREIVGVAFCDVSTGAFYVYQFKNAGQRITDELSRIAPREILVPQSKKETDFGLSIQTLVSTLPDDAFEYASAVRVLKKHFMGKSPADLGLERMRPAICAAGALMQYLTETQKNALAHILQIEQYHSELYMHIDRVAAANLELVESVRARSRKGSLLWVMDRTSTTMGSRMLRSWIEQPLILKEQIEARLDAVECLKNQPMRADSLRTALRDVHDVERLLSKIAYESINPRDCLALVASLKVVPELKGLLHGLDIALLQEVDGMLNPCDALTRLLSDALSPDAPIAVREGGIFASGYNEDLDQLRSASVEGKDWLATLEQKERDETGIKNLKVGFNRVFGYYIEVTKSNYNLIPGRYVRRQTLANCERFITEELKQIEKRVLGAEENAIRLEYELFIQIRARLKSELGILHQTAQGLKTLDALLAMALLALENDYVRPLLNQEGRIEILGGRHPVVEHSIGSERFVPNDTHITDQGRVMIITGPNMAGKSTYMRQVALIVLMAHVGSFVPAQMADISITDRIFTRIGASDDLYGGQSTFMVEMTELATILKYATPRSLLILDEVGRGTSTFDGLSIAWAAVEYIVKKCGARTLFATHYHELSELEGRLEGIVNYRITAKEQGDQVIFLRKIVPGGADRSYGVAVASLAGLPSSLISRARQIMARLEVNNEQNGSIGQSILDKSKNAGNRQVALNDYQPMELVEQIRALDVLSMSPIDALNKLYEIQEKARRI